MSYQGSVERVLQAQQVQESGLLALQDPESALDPYLGENHHGDPHLEVQPSLPLTSALIGCLKNHQL